jgi:hypothetical protein
VAVDVATQGEIAMLRRASIWCGLSSLAKRHAAKCDLPWLDPGTQAETVSALAEPPGLLA